MDLAANLTDELIYEDQQVGKLIGLHQNTVGATEERILNFVRIGGTA